jgi:hypothetical protein
VRREQRLSEARQQQLIEEARQRSDEYAQRLQEEQRLAQQRAELLQQQRRNAHYRYQQRYLERLRQQQLAAQNARSYNYSQDPFFYSAPLYGYSRGGRSYELNQFGADALRQSVNNGYEEGYRAGQADRQDGWSRGYRDAYAYEDANLGYNSLYVDQPEYNHYFRQGFERGYSDGYNSRSQYGRSVNGKYEILASLLSQILNLRSLQ